MKRILIIANTYYQLIMALQLKKTIFWNDEVVLFLSDRSNNAKNVYDHLKNGQYFDQVKYIETKFLVNKKSIIEKASNFFENVYVSNNRYKYFFEGIDNLYFDEMVSFNIDIMIYNFFAILYDINHNIKLSGFEEGILSYNAQKLVFPGAKQICKIRKVFGLNPVDNAYLNFYCFFPQLYDGIFHAVKVPLITENPEIIEILRDIFEIHDSDLYYPQKYIYFASVYDFEGGRPIGEIDIVRKIAKTVGNENLIVKVHPRDSRTAYTNEGIQVDKNSSKPWEAIQLLGDFSNKVFLTATSGSVLAGSFLSVYPIKTFYMYKLCDVSDNNSALVSTKNIELLVNDVSMKGVFEKVNIAECIEDIL